MEETASTGADDNVASVEATVTTENTATEAVAEAAGTEPAEVIAGPPLAPTLHSGDYRHRFSVHDTFSHPLLHEHACNESPHHHLPEDPPAVVPATSAPTVDRHKK